MILLSGATETGIAEDVATRAGRTGSPGKARAGDRDRLGRQRSCSRSDSSGSLASSSSPSASPPITSLSARVELAVSVGTLVRLNSLGLLVRQARAGARLYIGTQS